MESLSNKQESYFASGLVFQLPGEPAVVINGVPDVNPVPDSFTQLEMPIHPDSNDEICFGEWMVGRKVSKMFGDEYYSGKVVKFDREMKWYRVVYEDGDLEDLDWHELEEVLVPLDISISLRKVALQTLKHANSNKESGNRSDESRKGHRTNNGTAARSATHSRRKHSKKAGKVDKKSKILQSPEGAKSEWKSGADLIHGSSRKSMKLDTYNIIGSNMTNVEIKELDLHGSLESELQKAPMAHPKMLLDKDSDVGKSTIYGTENATASMESEKTEEDPREVSGKHMIKVEIKEVVPQG